MCSGTLDSTNFCAFHGLRMNSDMVHGCSWHFVRRLHFDKRFSFDNNFWHAFQHVCDMQNVIFIRYIRLNFSFVLVLVVERHVT